jgi:exodeoxyribonuclease V alpha subunit
VLPAFCITVHKSQGSEYDHVGVVLPPDAAHPLLTRQLVYTAVSRARRSLALWADQDVLAAALARPAARLGGLRTRLHGTQTA